MHPHKHSNPQTHKHTYPHHQRHPTHKPTQPNPIQTQTPHIPTPIAQASPQLPPSASTSTRPHTRACTPTTTTPTPTRLIDRRCWLLLCLLSNGNRATRGKPRASRSWAHACALLCRHSGLRLAAGGTATAACVYVCVCVFVCVYLCFLVQWIKASCRQNGCGRIYVCARVLFVLCIRVSLRMCVCPCICVYVSVCPCVCVRACVWLCEWM